MFVCLISALVIILSCCHLRVLPLTLSLALLAPQLEHLVLVLNLAFFLVLLLFQHLFSFVIGLFLVGLFLVWTVILGCLLPILIFLTILSILLFRVGVLIDQRLHHVRLLMLFCDWIPMLEITLSFISLNKAWV